MIELDKNIKIQDVTDFHFYHELKKEKYYDPLIPKKEAGLVVVLLYEWWKSGKYSANSFTEEAVKQAIEQVDFDLGQNVYERKPHVRFKEINICLQEYFLLRNEETNLYNITQYGIEFCERISEKLILEFKPSDIEKILADLIDSLKKYIEKEDFEYWFKHQFIPQRGTIKNQVETLLRRVEDAVGEFRKSTKSDDATFLEIVRRVDESLETIKNHSQELKEAFFGAEEIKALLLELSFQNISTEIASHKESVRQFIEEVNNDLSIISQRIDRIRPKLRQFISSINQRNFDSNTKLFLEFLLKKSHLIQQGNKNKIQLPKELVSKVIWQPESKFIIVEEDRLQPKQPTPIILPKEDKEKRKKQLTKAEDGFFIRNRVRYWLSELENQLLRDKNLNFSQAYYSILDKETNYGNTIAIKVASGLFRKYTKRKDYKVKVSNQMIINNQYPNQAVWKMNINKI